MRIELPTGARLQNIEAFTRRISHSEESSLELVLPDSYFSVHPMVLATVAAAGLRALRDGGIIRVPNIQETHSTRYLHRMGLFKLLQIDTGLDVIPREEAGRFIPLRVVRTGQELSNFIIELVPLFHTEPRQAEPIQYVISELVRNTLEHSGVEPAAVVAAQVFPKSRTVAIGVADAGRGIRDSLATSYGTPNDLAAIQLAMRPGVTGTTRRLGGTADNAGAGLFFCKALAYTSRNYFVMYSGSGLFKLLLCPRDPRGMVIYGHSEHDRATRHSNQPYWPGTAVGIDLDISGYAEFSSFLAYIRKSYDLDVRAQKKAKNKARARFI